MNDSHEEALGNVTSEPGRPSGDTGRTGDTADPQPREEERAAEAQATAESANAD